jgi:hypothetical protein
MYNNKGGCNSTTSLGKRKSTGKGRRTGRVMRMAV